MEFFRKKKYHFLSGLPRSGNTLLSALLNQNPEIYSSPLSPLSSLLWEQKKIQEKLEHTKRNYENVLRADDLLVSFIDVFYSDVEKPVVIDREKTWGTPANLNIIKNYITPQPKIILTVRDILEIIASFISMNSDYLAKDVEKEDLYYNYYRSFNDAAAEYLMRPGGQIDKALLGLAPAFFPENKGIFHIVEYNDLLAFPQETMNKIYDFLDMPHYEHNFSNINKIEKDDDENCGLPHNIHSIRKTLSRSSVSLDILSDYVKHKYSKMEFWREDSIIKIKGKNF